MPSGSSESSLLSVPSGLGSSTSTDCFVPSGPALSVRMDGRCGRARALTLMLPHGAVHTPVFMPVGTKGTIKGVTMEEMRSSPIGCEVLLSNTYHLAVAPGADVVRAMGGLHEFMGWSGNVLTDSGGFQMVSLLSLAEITEEGVRFQSPTDGTELMLTPEESVRTQHRIGSDIVMCLDDVVHSCTNDDARFLEATDRTVRWLDRCLAAHASGGAEDAAQGFKSGPAHQNLFAIVQGGLDVSAGGLRERCLRAFAARDAQIPGYAIGGLAGGESKDAFWRVVDKCCRGLPEGKPRYLMGVGYPLDIVVCSALGVDMYDCVYPTRTARFGTAFSPQGLVKLKHKMHALDFGPIYEGCPCRLCQPGPSGAPNMTKSSIYWQLRSDADSVASAVTHHNIVYMLTLVRQMRAAIIAGTYPHFVRAFLQRQIVDHGQDVPRWVVDALAAAGIDLPGMPVAQHEDQGGRDNDDKDQD